MAVPKKKTTPSRRNMRRSHDALKAINVVIDKTTGNPKLSHHISLTDGHYNNRSVIVKKVAEESDSE